MQKVKLIIFFSLITLLFPFNLFSQISNEDCMMCHEDKNLTSTRNGKTVSFYVNKSTLRTSVHRSVKCVSCHKDVQEDFPHSEGSKKLKKVNCGSCHTKANSKYSYGLHGQGYKRGDMYAPSCKECHGQHDILSRNNPRSRTYKMNIPLLCGKCHKENAPVARVYNISEHNILENYSQDIHGIGIYKQGLIVSATCNDCHGNHGVLPHTNPKSTIYHRNIASTCMQCHIKIEEVHTKVINEELWEKSPGQIPACSDCHLPHKVKIKKIVQNVSNQECLKCHQDDGIHKMVNGEKHSLTVKQDDLLSSVHKKIECVKCHADVNMKLVKPCETAKKEVNCTTCHEQISNDYFDSGHGKAHFAKKADAPYCIDCHGSHKILSSEIDSSITYKTNIPKLCGDCHKKDGRANANTELKEVDSYFDYSMSVHGKGVDSKGLLVSAVCTDCHSTHYMLKADDPRASIYSDNIPATCAKCHKGIYDKYVQSDHAINQKDGKEYPTCINCHSAHQIKEVDKDAFTHELTDQCGQCHKDLAETYLETYHGQAYKLGDIRSAKCSDCHGAHKILRIDNPLSLMSKENRVQSCKKCHANANKEFANYIAHATHRDKSKYPVLYYTYWAMTGLLIGVFGFFGLHTLLWFPRSLRERRRKKHAKIEGEAVYFRRFTVGQRWTHVFVIISFLLLALTGMMLKFSHMPWAQTMIKFFGSVKAAGNIHRFGAIITFGYFLFHLYSLIVTMIKKKKKFKDFFFGKNSLMPNMQDLKDFGASIKWFIGKGPRPNYGRWTYWEKFDYMAVFWGVAVIGFSGLVLWFPEFFSMFLPGKVINIAQIIHSDEALLAVGFIFTIHFFNTHLRPEAFPMDTVIFTGHYPEEEYKEERPKEYKELEESGELEKRLVKREFSDFRMTVIRIFGFLAVIIGLTLTAFIIYSILAG